MIELLQQLQHDTGIGILFVTHNLPLVAAIADTVVVMRDGEVVEQGAAGDVLRQPGHGLRTRADRCRTCSSLNADVVASPLDETDRHSLQSNMVI